MMWNDKDILEFNSINVYNTYIFVDKLSIVFIIYIHSDITAKNCTVLRNLWK